MKDGIAEPSASASCPWKTAQSSIFAASSPVITLAYVAIGIRQLVREPDQSKGPLQFEAVVNTAIHLNARQAAPSFR